MSVQRTTIIIQLHYKINVSIILSGALLLLPEFVWTQSLRKVWLVCLLFNDIKNAFLLKPL